MKTGVHRGRSMTLATLALALVLPGTAHAAASKPTVTTKAASNVAATTVQLNGSVNPNGAKTRYLFQLGPNSLYGSSSPETDVGNGTKAVNVSTQVTNLTPATTYHYRIVAINSKGISKGADRTFKTKRQPLALTLTAPENPLKYNATTALSGQLSGTGGGGRQIQLQYNAFPFTVGFQNLGNPVVTNADGTYSVQIPPQTLNTQFRAVLPANDAIVSPIVGLGVKVRVTTKARNRRLHSGGRVRFSGTIGPAADGQDVVVQKLVKGAWRDVASTVGRHTDAGVSTYRRRVKVRHSGSYRVFVNVTDGAHVSNFGRTIKVKVIRR
jgi:hypothetical protein